MGPPDLGLQPPKLGAEVSLTQVFHNGNEKLTHTVFEEQGKATDTRKVSPGVAT